MYTNGVIALDDTNINQSREDSYLDLNDYKLRYGYERVTVSFENR